MIETRTLLLFVALAEELHFARAGLRLGLSQSVVSTLVRRLEDRLATRLFERGRRSAVVLTPAGRIFLAEARSALERLGRAERIGRQAGRGEAGTRKVGYVFSAAASGVLSRVLGLAKERLPLLNLTVEAMETPEQIAAVADGRVDLGFIRPRLHYPSDLRTHIIHREGLAVAMNDAHALVGKAAIDASMLAGETFIVPQFGEASGLMESVARVAEVGGFEPPPVRDTRDFVTALSMAAAGYGIVMVPLSLTHIGIPGIRYRELVDHADEVALAMIWRQGGERGLVETVLGAADATR